MRKNLFWHTRFVERGILRVHFLQICHFVQSPALKILIVFAVIISGAVALP
jgi:hypothetical protein